MRRALVAALVLASLTPRAAGAQEAPARVAIVVIIDGASIPQLLAVPELRALAAHGGSALMNGRTPVRESLSPKLDMKEIGPLPFTNHGIDLGDASPAEAAARIVDFLRRHPQPTLAMVVSASPSAASAADGDELGTVIAAWGDPDELLRPSGEPKALTSDSTRRAGVVADVDPAATVAEWLDLPNDAGAPIRPTDQPAPLDLYDRYLQQRRLAVPVAAASWILVGIAAIAAIVVLRAWDRWSERTVRNAATLVASFPWLALSLLLVGHLPSLTVWTVTPFVLAVTAAGTAFTAWSAARWGTLRGIAAAGAAILAILLVEVLLGWPAAVTPLAGGGQLDGGRFFGMPNAEVGLVLGAALYVAHRVGAVRGAILLAGCALVAGSPWTGSNLGAAITLSAAAGLWLGVRGDRPWWITAILMGITGVLGTALVAAMHRYLTDRPTHITAAVEGGGPAEALDRVVDRLGIGLQLIADNPAALVPVIGTLILLPIVLRPPAAVGAAFARSEAWRDAMVVLVLASIVAYLVEDTGAAALGFGFVLALTGLLYVSLMTAREKMGR